MRILSQILQDSVIWRLEWKTKLPVFVYRHSPRVINLLADRTDDPSTVSLDTSLIVNGSETPRARSINPSNMSQRRTNLSQTNTNKKNTPWLKTELDSFSNIM